MKKNLYIYGLLLLIISTNIALIVRNNVLNKAIKEYISEEYINMDYKTQLYNYIDARIYEQTLEKNVKVRAEMEKMGGKIYKRFRVFQKKL